jgi:eukaryotic-like serine/threonine-protein kinase
MAPEPAQVNPTASTFRKVGKVELLSELGTGAGSRVFHVRRQADGRDYALKVVAVTTAGDRKFLEQARTEFRVGRLLDHPNLMKVHALDVETDWLFRPRRAKLLLELAHGHTLDRLPPLAAARLVRIFERVADALAHMHDQGVFHADLKPSNLILGAGTNVKVIDYGLAGIEGEPKHRAQGTPEYMAPETKARAHIDRRTDVFNLGATLYHLLTRRHLPVSPPGLILEEGSYRRQVVPVAALNPDAPPELCEVVHWCVEYDPNRRPQSMAELRAALAEVVTG